MMQLASSECDTASTVSTSTVHAAQNETNGQTGASTSPYFSAGQSCASTLSSATAQTTGQEPGVITCEPVSTVVGTPQLERNSPSKPSQPPTPDESNPNRSTTDGQMSPHGIKIAETFSLKSPSTVEPSGGEENDYDAYYSYINGMCNAANRMRIECNQQGFTCLVCGKIFDIWRQLKRHLRIHADFRPFKCELCPKSFYDFNKLKRHSQTHTGVKPYQCHICDQKVSRPEHLKRHMLTHVEGNPYKCSACDFTARRPDRVRTHQHKVHIDTTPTDLTVITLDVKLPDGILESPIVNTAKSKSGIRSEPSGINSNSKMTLGSLDVQIPGGIPDSPVKDGIKSNSSGANADEHVADYTASVNAGSRFGTIQSLLMKRDNGPVFPGQISPGAHSSEPKRLKLEHATSSGEVTNASFTNSAICDSNSEPTINSSSRRMTQPIKREPDQTQEHIQTGKGPLFIAPASFEGFGTTDFSSLGVPGSFVQNSCVGKPVLSETPGSQQDIGSQGGCATFPFGYVTCEAPSGGVTVKQEPNSNSTASSGAPAQRPSLAHALVTPNNNSVFQQVPAPVPLALYRNTYN